ncbi:transposase InsO family protein [Streptomyces sp. MJP52]|nr:transposase InsO family protein [Streptomyces sp. MJP52]
MSSCVMSAIEVPLGRVGAAGDNAAMESFFALLQKSILDRRPWRTRNELRIAIVTWIERTTTADGAGSAWAD